MNAGAIAKIVLNNSVDETRRLGPWLEEVIPETEFASARAEIEMALVELVSNIVRHGYGTEVAASITLELQRDDGRVAIAIRDEGRPVPPWARQAADAALDYDPTDLEALPTGGIGLAMAMAAVDQFTYEEGDGVNVTRIEKGLHPAV